MGRRRQALTSGRQGLSSQTSVLSAPTGLLSGVLLQLILTSPTHNSDPTSGVSPGKARPLPGRLAMWRIDARIAPMELRTTSALLIERVDEIEVEGDWAIEMVRKAEQNRYWAHESRAANWPPWWANGGYHHWLARLVLRIRRHH